MYLQIRKEDVCLHAPIGNKVFVHTIEKQSLLHVRKAQLYMKQIFFACVGLATAFWMNESQFHVGILPFVHSLAMTFEQQPKIV